MVWQPILVGEAADRARAAVLDIARAFAEDGGVRPKATDAPVFWAYVAGAFDEPWIQDRYDEAVDALVARAEHGFLDSSLYYGAAANGFAIAHVSEAGSADDYLAAIDRVILDALAAERWTGE